MNTEDLVKKYAQLLEEIIGTINQLDDEAKQSARLDFFAGVRKETNMSRNDWFHWLSFDVYLYYLEFVAKPKATTRQFTYLTKEILDAMQSHVIQFYLQDKKWRYEKNLDGLIDETFEKYRAMDEPPKEE